MDLKFDNKLLALEQSLHRFGEIAIDTKIQIRQLGEKQSAEKKDSVLEVCEMMVGQERKRLDVVIQEYNVRLQYLNEMLSQLTDKTPETPLQIELDSREL